MSVVGRAQQQQRGRQRAAGDHHDVGGIGFLRAIAFHLHGCDHSTGGIGVEARRVRAGQQRHVRMGGQRRLDADDFRIGLAVGRTRIAVEGAAADAWTRTRHRAVLLVKQDAERHVERMQPLARERVRQLLHPRLVCDRRKRIRRAAARFGRVFAGRAVHVEKLFGFVVVGREHVVLQWPLGRDAIGVADFLEVALAQAEQRGAVHLGIAAHEIMQARMERLAGLVVPGFVRLVRVVDEDRLRAPVVR
ncbi:MAG: hypothetical protein OJF61_002969 [Rhodanobacteraceae bacterium]|jgi:hypothetical protein|nr:MAG: hypothetical protein OJF61_002969 [Rhodanobacteraceae bacterium]